MVLGYRNRGERANFINRSRVRAALRSIEPSAATTLVFCGGSVGGPIPEAALMARYARDELGYAGAAVLEARSRTTWENVVNAVRFIEDADRIKIVSNSLHAEKGRAYLRHLRPDLADRLVRAGDYRCGELVLVKPIMVLIAARDRRRGARRNARQQKRPS